MKKESCSLIILFSLAAFIIIGMIMATYSQAHQGGWYCEYCHQGSIRNKYEVEQIYGNQPCACSEDSCHHFVHYFSKPGGKPKYLK